MLSLQQLLYYYQRRWCTCLDFWNPFSVFIFLSFSSSIHPVYPVTITPGKSTHWFTSVPGELSIRVCEFIRRWEMGVYEHMCEFELERQNDIPVHTHTYMSHDFNVFLYACLQWCSPGFSFITCFAMSFSRASDKRWTSHIPKAAGDKVLMCHHCFLSGRGILSDQMISGCLTIALFFFLYCDKDIEVRAGRRHAHTDKSEFNMFMSQTPPNGNEKKSNQNTCNMKLKAYYSNSYATIIK